MEFVDGTNLREAMLSSKLQPDEALAIVPQICDALHYAHEEGGVIFYEMLTGELPLGQFEPPSHKVQVDVRLDEVVLRSLAKEPARRYQNASDVKLDVERIAKFDGPPVQTPARIRPSEEVVESDPDTTPQYGVLMMGSVMAVLGLTFIMLQRRNGHTSL
jgi:serine/threonine protein kinase